MATITVDYVELDGSGGVVYDREGGGATLRLLTDYRDADQLCQEAMGATVLAGQAIQIRTAPMQHPRRPHLYCRQANYDGYGVSEKDGADGFASYAKAIVTLSFWPLERPEADQDPDNPVYLTEQREIVSNLITLPPAADNRNALYWAGGPEEGYGLHDRQTTAVVQNFMRVRISIRQWIGHDPSDPDDPFTTYANSINEYDITFLWKKWPKYTLLYEGGTLSRDYTLAGKAAWRIDMAFLYNRHTWRKLMASDGLYYLVESENGAQLYQLNDFAKLLPS